MRGKKDSNFPAFDDAAIKLCAAGWYPWNPAQHDREAFGYFGVDGENNSKFVLAEALRWDFSKIIEAGNICLLDGWEDSEGVAKELRVAEDIGAGVWRLTGEKFVEWTYDLVHEKQALAAADPTREHRVTSATGGEKGQKDARLGALDAVSLIELAKVGGMGEEKYSRFNYLKGYAWSLSVDALYRHLLAFLSGEDCDEESGLPHTAHAAWHALCLTSFLKRGIGTDDRAY
jgi:hypothetical protein